jgi:hypothetical protein
VQDSSHHYNNPIATKEKTHLTEGTVERDKANLIKDYGE